MPKTIAEVIPLGDFKRDDAETFVKWMWKQKEESNFDSKVLAAPRTCMLKASRGPSVICFAPVQPVLMIESLCKNEKVSQKHLALALYEINALVLKIMRDGGFAEAYFTTGNEEFANFCEKQSEGRWKKHLFDKSKNTWLMKLQVSHEI